IEHRVLKLEEADPDAMDVAIQRAASDLIRLERDTGVPQLASQPKRIFERLFQEPVEVHGPTMTEVESDRRAASEIKAVFSRPRSQETECLELFFGEDLPVEAHGRARRS